MSSAAAGVKVGDKVVVLPHSELGVVKFVGNTDFAKGVWVGVELNNPVGKNNGFVGDRKYFDCPPDYGIFVRPENVRKQKTSDPSPRASTSGRPKTFKRSSSSAALEFFDAQQLVLGSAHGDLFPAAIDYENMNFLKILIEEDGVPITGVDMQGNSVLHHVCNDPNGIAGKKAVKVLEYLISKGCLPLLHQRNLSGQTAVMCASHNHNWDAMEYLVGIGADVIYKGNLDTLPSVWDDCRADIQNAMPKLYNGMAEQKKRRSEGKIDVPAMKHKVVTLVQALFKTAHAGDMNYVRMLVEEKKLNVNETDTEGNTVLHWIGGDPKRLALIKYFVAEGAKVHHKNKVGDTACLVAARARNWEVMKFLISVGSSVSVKDQTNKKSVFKYAQVNAQSRKALQEGLALKKKNLGGSSAGDESDVESEDKNYTNDDNESEMSDATVTTVDGFHSAEEVLADIKAHNEELPQVVQVPVSPKVPPLNSAALASAAAAAAPQAVLSPTSAAAAGLVSPRPTRAINSAGTFSGAVIGKKKNKKKEKVCKVQITDQGVLLQYKKGAILRRKDVADEYTWNDQMSITKENDTELAIVLDPDNEIVLRITNCPADMLEEFIWKNIWKSVFEGSVKEAKELLSDYQALCKDTTATLEADTKRLDDIHATKMQLYAKKEELNKSQDFKGAQDVKDQITKLTTEEDQLEKSVANCTARFASIRKQGETLKETYAKMYEALDRRLQAETQRLQEFSGKEMFSKAEEVKADQVQIKEQMASIEGDKNLVEELYESMKGAELQYTNMNTPAAAADAAAAGDDNYESF